MDIKYSIENEYMKCVLQINRFSGSHPQVRSSCRVGSGQESGGARQMKRDVFGPVVQALKGVKPVGYKWVFVQKHNKNNEIIRYKA